jgi:hypothetical protein
LLIVSVTGSHTECQYALLTFGFQVDLLPVDADGNLRLENLVSWVGERKKLEAQRKVDAPNWIEFPLSTDIVLGRGRPYQEHPGNRRLLNTVENYSGSYGESGRQEKVNITRSIVQLFKNANSRFLKRHDQPELGWEEVSDDLARDKTSHCKSEELSFVLARLLQ